jgi:NAD+ kinase
MKCLLVSRIDLPGALSCARQMRAALEREGVTVILEKDTAVCLGGPGIPCDQTDADVAVVIGGDGTILRTVQQMQHQIPIIGINHGEVGFLADLEPDEAWDFVKTLVSGFEVEERMRISLMMNNKPLGDALNEALIVTTRPAKMLRFSIIIDGRVSEQFRSDGLLVSTPTGSTAYAMSAGGPIVDPRIQGFLVVPLAPYMLSSRPHIISSNRKLEIRLECSKPAKLVIDGQKTVELGSTATLVVQKAEQPALFVDAYRNFFEKVDDKLRKL